MCRELGYTLAELEQRETFHNLRLWYILRLVEQDEARAAELKQKALVGLAENKGRWTRGHRTRI